MDRLSSDHGVPGCKGPKGIYLTRDCRIWHASIMGQAADEPQNAARAATDFQNADAAPRPVERRMAVQEDHDRRKWIMVELGSRLIYCVSYQVISLHEAPVLAATKGTWHMAEIATDAFYVPGFMDLSKYRLERTHPGPAWDRVVETAPEGTIFSLSAFVEEMDATPALWLCHKGNQLAGAVALAEDRADPFRTVLAPHIIHGGIMTAPAAAHQNPAQALAEQFRATAACFEQLAGRYTELRFATAPALADLRPVLWHNYGTDGPKPALELRYTSYLPLASDPDGTRMEKFVLYLGCNKSRRQALRYAQASGIAVQESSDLEAFLDLYARTFARQGLKMAPAEADFLRRVCTRLAAEGRLRMFAALTPEGDLGSMVVFGLDAKRAYYLYGANEPALRSDHCGSMALFHALHTLGQEGVAEADLEGVNSPKRGYFKLSFGGDLRAYYRVSLVQG